MLTRAGGLYGSIERKELGLEDDVIDDLGLLTDLLDQVHDSGDLGVTLVHTFENDFGAALDLTHGTDELVHRVAPCVGQFMAFLRCIHRACGVVAGGVYLDHVSSHRFAAHYAWRSQWLGDCFYHQF